MNFPASPPQLGQRIAFSTSSPFSMHALTRSSLVRPSSFLELLERGELHAEGVRRLVEAQATATPVSRQAASS